MRNNTTTVKILLQDGNANPNVVNNYNQTGLMLCVTRGARGNLSIVKLLTEYGFDYAKLVNKRENITGTTVFNALCMRKYADDPIGCMKYLFQVCKKIPNCSINIMAKNQDGMCGLHIAIREMNADMVKYLLENVYFPNNDKLSNDGIGFMNMKYLGKLPLANFCDKC